MNFPMKQMLDGKEVDLEKIVVDSANGLDVNAQKANVATAAAAFNQLLPIVPLWERYGNSPLLNKRLADAPPDTDPIPERAVCTTDRMIWRDFTLGTNDPIPASSPRS
jgi:peptide/nickel transport system substrate-binding protein